MNISQFLRKWPLHRMSGVNTITSTYFSIQKNRLHFLFISQKFLIREMISSQIQNLVLLRILHTPQSCIVIFAKLRLTYWLTYWLTWVVSRDASASKNSVYFGFFAKGRGDWALKKYYYFGYFTNLWNQPTHLTICWEIQNFITKNCSVIIVYLFYLLYGASIRIWK